MKLIIIKILIKLYLAFKPPIFWKEKDIVKKQAQIGQLMK